MKLPQAFLPSKDLEERIRQLLKNPPNKFQYELRDGKLYEELKKEFPDFTDYLFNLYPGLGIFHTKDKKGTVIWQFFTIYPKKTSPLLVCKIKSYSEERGTDTTEYGYKSQVLIKEKWHNLKYRKGYRYLTLALTLAESESPLRIDKHKKIPFP